MVREELSACLGAVQSLPFFMGRALFWDEDDTRFDFAFLARPTEF